MTARAEVEAALFTLEVSPERERVRVALAGELDMADAERVVANVRDLLDRGFRDIALDVRDLTFVDSSGIRALVASTRTAHQRGARLEVVLAPGAVARAVELCCVQDQLNVARS
jgi:anti-sigma B factor antagonist